MLKKLLLARLRDQPSSYRYPESIIRFIESSIFAAVQSRIENRMQQGKSKVYDDIWWEIQGAIGDQRALRPLPRKIHRLVTDRRLPMSYATGSVEFMGMDMKLNPPILIPRQDTAAWLHRVIQLIKANGYSSILDVGFGSGCISLGLAAALSNLVKITGIDCSQAALRLANLNKHRLRISNVEFIKVNMADYEGCHQVVISNPPYIRRIDRAVNVSPSTRGWESHSALHCPDIEGSDDYGTYYHQSLIDRIASGALSGCKMLAMELDGTRRQFDMVKFHAEKRGFRTDPISDGRKKFRAINILTS